MAARRHNTQTSRDRQRLLADFERRLRYAEEHANFRNQLRYRDSLAWVVHPLADEAELLTELELSPEDCWCADAYWRYAESVYFIQLYGRGQFREPGVYYSFDRQYRRDVFDIGLHTSTVTSADFQRAFAQIGKLVDTGVIAVERARLRDSDSRWSTRSEPFPWEFRGAVDAS